MPQQFDRMRVSIDRILSHVKPGTLHHQDEQARGKERYRRVALSVIAAAGSRGVALAMSLLSVPLTVTYLGTEQFGIWVAIQSIGALLSFGDLGIANGLVNGVAQAAAHDDHRAVRRYISSAVIMITTVAALLMTIFIFLFHYLSWKVVLNLHSHFALSQARPAIGIFVLLELVSLPLSLTEKIQAGHQEEYIANGWAAVGNVLSLAMLVAAALVHAPLPWLVVSVSGGPVFAKACNSALFFAKRSRLRPSVKFVDRQTVLRLLRLGLLFLVLQLGVAVAYSTDTFVATQLYGPESAATYSVAFRMFALVPSLVSLVFLPLWPAYSDAWARHDYSWIRRALVISTCVAGGITGCASSILVFTGEDVATLWTHGAISPTFGLLLAMGVWATMSNAFAAVSTFLVGASILKFQVVCVILMAPTSLGLSILLGRQFGIAGIAWGTIVAYIFCSAVPTVWYVPRLLRKAVRVARIAQLQAQVS